MENHNNSQVDRNHSFTILIMVILPQTEVNIIMQGYVGNSTYPEIDCNKLPY